MKKKKKEKDAYTVTNPYVPQTYVELERALLTLEIVYREANLEKPEKTLQAIEQIKSLIEAQAENDEIHAQMIDIVVDLYEQLDKSKPKVNRKLIKKHAVHMSLNAFYDADDFKQGKIAPFEYPRVENALVKFSEEAGLEVEE